MNTNFETGQTYSVNSVCDQDCIWKFKIIKRTAKNVWVIDATEKAPIIQRKKIHVWNDVESIFPLGSYSMAPILRADKKI